MADRKITELTAMSAGTQATGDLLTIVDVSEAAAVDKNKKITVESLFQGIPGNVGIGKASSGNKLEIEGQGNTKVVIDGRTDAANGSLATLELWSKNSSGTNNFGFIEYDGDGSFDIGSGGGGAGSVPLVFKTNAVERLRIDSSGKVGIGTSSPTSKLEIAGNNAGNDEDYVNVNNAFRFKETDSTLLNGQPTGSILWETSDNSDSGVHAYIACRGSSSGAGQLAFGTGLASNLDTRLFISSTGNVGIGTTSAAGKLHVFKGNGARNDYSTSADGLVIESSSDTGLSIDPGAGNTANIYFPNAANHSIGSISHSLSTGELNLRAATYLRFAGSSNTERMRIDSSGKVGIGTSSPSNKLHVEANNSSADLVYFNNTGVTASDVLRLNTAGTGSGTNIFDAQAGGTSRFLVRGDGNVGIGTTSPADNLHISDGTFAGVIVQTGRTTSGLSIGSLLFRDGSSNNSAELLSKVGGTLLAKTNGTERMRINSGGTIIVGGTGTVDAGVVLSLQATSSEDAAEIKVRTNGQNAIQFRNASNVDVGKITINVSSTVYATSSDYRLKENVVNIADGITRVKQLQPKRFNFIADADTTVDGFLAHEAQAIVPEAVTGTHDEVDDDGNAVMQGIDQSKLVPLLTAALQEAIAKIETLETKVAALEAG